MGRAGSLFLSILCVAFLGGLIACSGGGNATNIISFPTPSIITLVPGPSISMDLGSTLIFTATPEDNSTNALITPVTYQSSNTAVLTIATNGLACAGTWNSQANPQICTPGPPGVALVTATAQGVSSTVTTVSVHQHIDNIQVSAVTGETQPASFQQFGCFSKGQTFNLQATAYSRNQSGLSEITSTVGEFLWQSANSNVATVTASTLNAPLAGLSTAQAQVTATTPGVTTILASVSNTIGVPFTFTTCPVQSIQIAVNGSTTPSFTTALGTQLQFSTVVTDIAGNTITGAPLTWSSSAPDVIPPPASSTDTGSGSASTIGGAAITASCTPPSCNAGIQPSLPVYPKSAVDMTVRSNSTSALGATVVVSSTGCKQFDSCTSPGCQQISQCVSTLVPITDSIAGGIGTLTLSNPITLPSAPDSLAFDAQGGNLYLGTDSGAFGTKGIMVMIPNSTTAIQYPVAPGKFLAVSPNGAKVITSDTQDTPQQVFVFDTAAHSVQTLPISGATAAAFSPDGLKAYILAGSELYVYSQEDALQSTMLSAPATEVAFTGNGMLGYLAGGDPAGASFASVCDGAPVLSPVGAPNTSLIRELPSGSLLTLSTSNSFGLITPNITGAPTSTNFFGCPVSRAGGFWAITNTVQTLGNLGAGFTPTQLLISSDGTRAYVLAANLASILVYNINNGTTSSIALAGNAGPVGAGLSKDGSVLFVLGTDGAVHALDTAAQVDTQQITFPTNFCQDATGNPAPFPCPPDLIAVRP